MFAFVRVHTDGGENLVVTVNSANKAYKMTDGCLFEIATNTVLHTSSEASVPEGTKIIEMYAFMYCKSETLEIPASVEKVQAYAFYGWTEKQTIIINGFASQEEATAAWGELWNYGCKATIIYKK